MRAEAAEKATVKTVPGREVITVTGIPAGDARGYHPADPKWRETPAALWALDFAARQYGPTLVISSIAEVRYIHHDYHLEDIEIEVPPGCRGHQGKSATHGGTDARPVAARRQREALMRRIRYAVAMSLDAYIAGPNGESDWIIMDPEIDFGEMFAQLRHGPDGPTDVRGRESQGGGGSMPGMKTVVVSRTLRPQDYPDITVDRRSGGGDVARLRAEPGKDIWLFGGGSLFRSLLDARLVDTVEVAVVPVLLGGGFRCCRPRRERAKLRLVGSKVYKTGIVSLEYAIAR